MTDVHEPTAPAAEPTRLVARDRRLLLGAALSPLAWSLHLALSYGLVYPALRLRSKAALVAVTVVCWLWAVTGSMLAFSARRAGEHENDLGAPGSAPFRPRRLAATPEQAEARKERAFFLGTVAGALGLFFAAVILAQSVPIVVFSLEDP
jgi:hypothetical protein